MKNNIKRVIWIILDSVGIGELPDAAEFGDVGTNTLENIASKEGRIDMPNMTSMGIGNIDGVTISCDSFSTVCESGSPPTPFFKLATIAPKCMQKSCRLINK